MGSYGEFRVYTVWIESGYGHPARLVRQRARTTVRVARAD